jgi:hypothetical protein
MPRRTSNEGLPDLPPDRDVLRAVATLAAEDPRADPITGTRPITAQRIAWKLGIDGARRHGRGAVQHSWTGTMAPALRIAPRLRSLEMRGLLWSLYDRDNYRHVWGVTRAGHELLEGAA